LIKKATNFAPSWSSHLGEIWPTKLKVSSIEVRNFINIKFGSMGSTYWRVSSIFTLSTSFTVISSQPTYFLARMTYSNWEI